MIVDTSAVLAILLGEPEGPGFGARIAAAVTPLFSAASFMELQAVLTRRFGGDLDDEARDLLARLELTIAPVTAEQARIGGEAYRTYGIGSGHPARLNFGDCFAYALAKATGQPLLFKGDDFSRTDIAAVA